MFSRLSALLLSGVLFFGSLPVSASTAIYGGAGAGGAKLKSTANDNYMANNAASLTAPSLSKDNSDIGYKLFVEFDFTKHIGLDIGYYVLGAQSWRVAGTYLGQPTSDKLTYKTTGLGLSLLGRLPLTDHFNFFGRAGAFSWHADAHEFSNDGRAWEYNNTGTSAMFGAGAEFKFMKAFGLRAEWERFAVGKNGTGNSGKATIDLISLSALFKFR